MTLQVDGNDILTTYGAMMVQGCAPNLLTWPKFKKITTVDWHEYNGIQADLANPVLDTRQLSLMLRFADREGWQDFISDITGNGSVSGMYHAFTHVQLNRTWTLRLVNNSAFNWNPRYMYLTLGLADDVPDRDSMIGPAIDHLLVPDQGYTMDDVNLGNYGIQCYKGTRPSLEKLPDVKQNITISPNDDHGVIYDSTGTAVYKSKTAVLHLHMHRPTIGNFMYLYQLFFNHLTASGLRVIYSEELDTYFYAYYAGQTIKKFMFTRDGGVWCDFELSLVISDWAETQQNTVLSIPDLQSVSANRNLVVVNSSMRQSQTRGASLRSGNGEGDTVGHSGLIRIADLPEAPEDHTGMFTIVETASGQSQKVALVDIGGGTAETDFDIVLAAPAQTVYEFTGTPVGVTLSFSFTKDGQAVTPSAMSVNGNPITPASSGTTTVQINSPDHHVFTLTATVEGITKSASVAVDMVCPMYIGFAHPDSKMEYMYNELDKVVALSAKGIYTYINNEEDYHLTVCLPKEFTLQDILSGGITVPMMDAEEDSLVIGSATFDYLVYRSVNAILISKMNFVIIP